MPVENLRVYQVAIELSKKVDGLVNRIPDHWKIKEIDQIERSSSSIVANISEGYGKQVYPKDYIRYLNIALGSSDETQSHILILYNRKYISKENYIYFKKRYKNLSVKILNLINKIRKVKNIPYK